jgi:HK97 family phage prohead protease
MATEMLHLTASQFSIDCAADGEPRRQITGLAVPWDTPTVDSLGTAVKFAKDSLPVDGRQPKLLEGHDPSQIRGVVTERVSTDEGMLFTAKIADTSAGRDAMQLLLMGAVDAVSVGVVPTKFHHDAEGVMVVEAAQWNELSLVPFPAFEQARIATVAASIPEASKPTTESKEDSAMSTPEVVEAAAPAVIPTEPIWAEAKREFRLPSMGDYIVAFLEGGHRFHQMNENIRKFAAPDVTTTDTPGVLPTPVVAPVYNNFRGIRPVVDAVGVRAMPQSGKVFIRPKVTTHTSIGTVTEGNTITSGTFVVDDVQITKGIYGGYVELSEASIDWSSPEVLNALLDDMSRIYANQTDDVAADALVAGATDTNNFTSASVADPAYWVEWIYTAASDILSNSNGNLPTHIFMAPNRWASLGQLSDTADRPLFPQVGPMNAFGSMAPGSATGNAFGLIPVVDRNFASGTLIVGHPDGFECWEQQKGVVSIENPSLLARTIAFRGYFSASMIDATKFIKAAFV